MLHGHKWYENLLYYLLRSNLYEHWRNVRISLYQFILISIDVVEAKSVTNLRMDKSTAQSPHEVAKTSSLIGS